MVEKYEKDKNKHEKRDYVITKTIDHINDVRMRRAMS